MIATTVSFIPKEVDLPQLSADKEDLENVLELDQMIVDKELVKQCGEWIMKEAETIRDAEGVDTNARLEVKIKQLLALQALWENFENGPKETAAKVAEKFKEKYESEWGFTEKYRQLLTELENELNHAIEDNALRRKVSSEVNNTYSYNDSCNLWGVTTQIEEIEQQKQKQVDSIINSSEMSLMVADYKKGMELIDLLNDEEIILRALKQTFAPDDERVSLMLEKIATKKESRIEEINKARSEYVFPKRDNNAPANAPELETTIQTKLEKNNYEVGKVVCASQWIDVKNVLGVHLYSQIDFYVAVNDSNNEAGVFSVCYVTGKCPNRESTEFDAYSIGVVAEMIEEQL